MAIVKTGGLPQPDRQEIELASVLHALSDPHRLHIVRRLSEESKPRACGGLEPGIAKSTLTHHLRVLREAGVIEQSREGTTKLTSLRREDLEARFPGLLDAVLNRVSVG